MSAKKEIESHKGIISKCKDITGIDHKSSDSNQCISCGQCTLKHDPTEQEITKDIEHVLKALKNKKVIATIAPSMRVSIGEEFGLPAGTIVTGKLVSALKKVGFYKVFDVTLGADIMIMEEAVDAINKIKNDQGPVFTSCCPSWVKYIEIKHPELKKNLGSLKSPVGILGTLIKTKFSKDNNIDPKEIVVVSIMPCTAKKIEIKRPEYKNHTDYVLTTREAAKLIKMKEIDFLNLKDEKFDNPFEEGSGAGELFGGTGGLMEAALRNAYEIIENKPLEKLNLTKLRGNKEIKTGSITIANKKINYAVVCGIKNAEKIIQEIKQEKKYDFIEVMACVGGCIGGGGQPRPTNSEVIEKRLNALYEIDKNRPTRCSNDNPEVKKLYKELLIKPGSEVAKKMLHVKL